MSDVVINFVGDTSGLAPVEDSLDGIIAQAGDVGQAWKKASDSMNTSNNTTVESSTKVVKSIADMAAAAKNMDKAVIGGAYKDYLKQIQTQLGLTNQELVKYINTAKAAAQQSMFSATSQDEADKIGASIQAMNEQLIQLGSSEDDTGNKTQSLRQRIKEVKLELTAMADAGLQGTPAFEKLKQKGGDLDKQMVSLNKTISNLGSEHKSVDGVISLMTGVAGGFAAAQGAAALFGDENVEVQKALQKVMGAMALLQGIQQISETLSEKSSGMLLIESLLRKNVATATDVQTASQEVNTTTKEGGVAATEAIVLAEGEQAVATDTATVAQVALNTAMELNPAWAVIAGLVALAEVIGIFISMNRTAEQTQLALNDAVKQSTEYLDIDLKTIDAKAKMSAALDKQRGASAVEMAAQEGKYGNERLKSINAQIAANETLLEKAKVTNKTTGEYYQKLLDTQLKLQLQYSSEREALEVKAVEFNKLKADEELKNFIGLQEAKVSATIAGTDAERNQQINTIRAISAEREKSADFIALTEGEKAKQRADDDRQIQALKLQNYQHYLKGRTDAQDAQVADAKQIILKNQVNSIESINAITDAEIKAEKLKREEALSNPSLNTGEQEKIIAESNLRIEELENQKQLKILEIQKSGISAQLLLAAKGSVDEYNAKLAMINKEQEIELAAKKLTQQQIDEINAKAAKAKHELSVEEKLIELTDEGNLLDAQLASYGKNETNKLNISLNRLDSQLDAFGKAENKKLELTIARLKVEESKEIASSDMKLSTIAAIIAKYNKQIRDANIASIESELTAKIGLLETYTHASKAADQEIISSSLSSVEMKIAANEDLFKQENAITDLKVAALKKELADKLISDKEYALKYQGILNEENDNELKYSKQRVAIYQAEMQQKLTLMKGVLDTVQKGIDASMESSAVKTALTNIISSYNAIGTAINTATANNIAFQARQAEINKMADDQHKKDAQAALDDQKAMSKKQENIAIFNAAVSTVQNTINQLFTDEAAARQTALTNTLNTLETEKNAELDNKNLTKEQIANINQKYADLEKQEKIKAWKADQKAKEEEAIINGAVAITKTFAELGFPAGLLMAGVIAAATAIQVAKIAGATQPQFRHGAIDIQGPGTTTSDSIHAKISKGESVIKADSTAKWKDALEAINNDKFESYMANNISKFIYPQVPDFLQTDSSKQIDYNKLAEAVASKMKGVIPASSSTHVNIDKNGITTMLISEHSKTEIKNRYFSMKS